MEDQSYALPDWSSTNPTDFQLEHLLPDLFLTTPTDFQPLEEHRLPDLFSTRLPDSFSTTPTDFQLLQEYLQRYMPETMNLPGGVNRRLSLTDPWELPGMPPDKEAGKKREKYFLTDCPDLLLEIYGNESPRTPQGFWRSRSLGLGIRDESNPSRLAGIKRTFDFHTGDPSRGCTKTNWVMNAYFLVGQDCYIQEEMALCHVFENSSPDYDPRPKCAAFHQPPNGKGSLSSTYPCSYQHSGKPCNLAIHGPSSSSFLSTNPVSGKFSDLELADTSMDVIASGENGQSRKRTKTSSVWERFTKIFAHGPHGVMVTFAACNHCCKVLTGDSRKGTSHLARHKCQCNH